MPVIVKAKLIKKEKINSDTYKFSIQSKEIASTANPGQFLEVKVSDNLDPFLRRPISIYNVEKDIVEFIFQVRGKGTKILAEKEVGSFIDIIGPLGYGSFRFEDFKNIAVIGGGVGIFPLYELAKRAKNQNINVNMYLGFRNESLVILENEFKEVSDNLIITTDDGSFGKSGFAIDYLENDIKLNKPDAIYACGPLGLLKAVKKFSEKENILCQISLEEKMGCGLGVCLGCAVKKQSSTQDNPEYFHICKMGPVFDSKDVEI